MPAVIVHAAAGHFAPAAARPHCWGYRIIVDVSGPKVRIYTEQKDCTPNARRRGTGK